MNREIKFKVWDISSETPKMRYLDPEMGFSSRWLVEDYETKIMQYTGLKDKNGKEIYEGDIVRWDDGSKGAYWRVAEVFWESKEALFSYRILYGVNCHIKTGYIFGSNFMYRDGSTLEVIGNIYENPELLENGIVSPTKTTNL